MRASLILSAICSLGSVALADDKDVPKALLPFQGTWEVKEMTGDPGALPKEKWPTFTFDGDKLTVQVPGHERKESATYSVSPDAKPAGLDIKTTNKFENVVFAIYKFEKETLTLCFALENVKKDRPTEFKAENGYAVIVLTKAKK